MTARSRAKYTRRAPKYAVAHAKMRAPRAYLRMPFRASQPLEPEIRTLAHRFARTSHFFSNLLVHSKRIALSSSVDSIPYRAKNPVQEPVRV